MRWRCLERALLCPEPCWDCPVPEHGGSGAVIATEMVPPYRARPGGSSGVGGTSLSLVPKPHCRPRAHPPSPGHGSLALCACCSGVPVAGQDEVGARWASSPGRNVGSGWWLTSSTAALRQLVPASRVVPEQPVLINPFDPGGRGRSPLSSQ